MQSLYIKDKNRRTTYFVLEKKKIILNYIFRNFKLSKNIRIKAYTHLNNHIELSYLTKIKNRCVLSNRARSVYRRFKLSRIFFKEEALKGFLMGIKKASW